MRDCLHHLSVLRTPVREFVEQKAPALLPSPALGDITRALEREPSAAQHSSTMRVSTMIQRLVLGAMSDLAALAAVDEARRRAVRRPWR
jgi:hypothetical protein